MNVEILDLDRQRSLYDSEYPVQLTCACKCTWTLVPSLEILCPIVKDIHPYCWEVFQWVYPTALPVRQVPDANNNRCAKNVIVSSAALRAMSLRPISGSNKLVSAQPFCIMIAVGRLIRYVKAWLKTVRWGEGRKYELVWHWTVTLNISRRYVQCYKFRHRGVWR